MADQDIQIRFRSVREGSGGQEQIDELDDLRERIDKLHQETRDLIESTDDLGDAGTRSSTKLDDLISIERAQVAAQIAEVVNRLAGALQSMAGELEAIDPEAADKLNDVGLAVQSLGLSAELAAKGFAVGGPMGAALGGFVGLATGPVKGAFQGMIADLKAAKIATDQAAKAEEGYQAFLDARAQAGRRASLEKMFANELRDIDAATAALERQLRVLEKRRQIDAAVREEEIRQFELGGGDAAQAARAQGQAGIDAKLAELRGQIDAANERARLAQDRADAAAANANRLDVSDAGITDAQVEQARAAAEAAATAAENARADAALAAQNAAEDARLLLAAVETSFREQTDAAGERITEAGAQAVELFNQAEQELGGLSAAATTFRAELQRLLGDAIPDEAQLGEFRNLFEGLRTTQEARDQVIFDGFSQVRETAVQTETLLRSILRDLQRQQEQINALR